MKNQVCFVFLLGLLTLSSGQAATNTWLNGSGGAWTNTANWQGGTLPGANDIAELSAATGTVYLTDDITLGEILYNPTPIAGMTNVLTMLSDTDASLRTLTLATTATNHLRVGEDAELQLDVDVLSNGNLLKDGYGTLVVKRRLFATSAAEFYEYWVEQGRLINEGTIMAPHFRLLLGTLEPETGPEPELVLRAGSAYLSASAAEHSDVRLGGNRLGEGGTGSRAIVTHEGGVLNLTTNLTNGAFINGYAAAGEAAYNLSGGEVDLSNKKVYVGFNGVGVINQSNGRFRAKELYFSWSSTGNGTYNLSGGELWLGGIAQLFSTGKAAFNIGGGCIYPFNKGFGIWDNTKPQFTGIGGLTRFCSEGSGYTNSISGFKGSGGFVKEGADTLNILGGEHSFTGPIIISNGTVNVSVPMIGGNAVTLVDGTLNLNAGAAAYFSTLMVTGGIFQISSNAVLALKSVDPWVRVRDTGTARLLDGSKLLRLDVEGAGRIDLSAGGTATVYRARVDGIELPHGFYSSANCAAITGCGLMYVSLQSERRSIIDTFSRADAPMVYDSLGRTEDPGGSFWSEFRHHIGVGNCASVNNGELRLGIGHSEPGLAVTAASWPDGMFSTRMRFKRIGAAGVSVKNACGLVMRRNITIRTGDTSAESADWAGTVYVLITPTGSLAVRENYRDDKYFKNPFTGSTDFAYYGPAGSLPTSINGLPFDANGDGRLGHDEPFDLSAILFGNRLQVLINGAPIMACNDFAVPSADEENCAGFWKNRIGSAFKETHDSYHDYFAITNLPYLIRHIGRLDPNVLSPVPLENWTFNGDTNAVPVGPITETIGGETVDAWRIDDASTAKLAYYKTDLSSAENADVNTNRWLLKARLRVVNDDDTIDASVFTQISTDSYTYSMNFGSDASGNAQIKINEGPIHTVAGGSVYHTYELEYDPVTATASLFCDGVALQTGIVEFNKGYKRVLWGANSSAGLGCAHFAEVQFSILWPEPPPLPKPPPPPPPMGILMILR